MKNKTDILAIGVAIGAINLAYYNVLDILPASDFTISMLGFVSLIVLGLGVYLGLRKIDSMRPTPPSLLHSLGFGMLLVGVAALTVILLRIATTAVSLSKYDSVIAYFESSAPQSTLFWYSVFGLVYCIGGHVVIHYQYTKSKNHE